MAPSFSKPELEFGFCHEDLSKHDLQNALKELDIDFDLSANKENLIKLLEKHAAQLRINSQEAITFDFLHADHSASKSELRQLLTQMNINYPEQPSIEDLLALYHKHTKISSLVGTSSDNNPICAVWAALSYGFDNVGLVALDRTIRTLPKRSASPTPSDLAEAYDTDRLQQAIEMLSELMQVPIEKLFPGRQLSSAKTVLFSYSGWLQLYLQAYKDLAVEVNAAQSDTEPASTSSNIGGHPEAAVVDTLAVPKDTYYMCDQAFKLVSTGLRRIGAGASNVFRDARGSVWEKRTYRNFDVTRQAFINHRSKVAYWSPPPVLSSLGGSALIYAVPSPKPTSTSAPQSPHPADNTPRQNQPSPNLPVSEPAPAPTPAPEPAPTSMFAPQAPRAASSIPRQGEPQAQPAPYPSLFGLPPVNRPFSNQTCARVGAGMMTNQYYWEQIVELANIAREMKQSSPFKGPDADKYLDTGISFLRMSRDLVKGGGGGRLFG